MVERDIAGFILNRIDMLANMEAMRLVGQGVATPDDMDQKACTWPSDVNGFLGDLGHGGIGCCVARGLYE